MKCSRILLDFDVDNFLEIVKILSNADKLSAFCNKMLVLFHTDPNLTNFGPLCQLKELHEERHNAKSFSCAVCNKILGLI